MHQDGAAQKRQGPHHSDPVSNGFGGQVGAELCSHHAAVSVGTGHLPPDHSGPVGFASRSHCVAGNEKWTNGEAQWWLTTKVLLKLLQLQTLSKTGKQPPMKSTAHMRGYRRELLCKELPNTVLNTQQT